MLSSILRGGFFLFKIIWQIIKIIFWPIKIFLKHFFKYIILPLYNFLHIFKKRHSESIDSSIKSFLLILNNRYLLSTLIFVLCFSVINYNLTTKNAIAEDMGKKTLLFRVSQGSEFSEDLIEETIEVDINDEETYELLARHENIDFLNIDQIALGKNELHQEQVADETLELESFNNQGLIADSLIKNSGPETFISSQNKKEISEYAVQSGDTISSIARKFKISINTILWANDLSGLSIIRPGDKLTILPTTGVLHKIKKGDTISALAKKYDVEQDEILSFNQLVSDEQLSIGQVVIVPDGIIKRTYATRSSSPSISNIFKSPSSEKNVNGFIWPAVGHKITQYYHWRHHAIDVGGKTGSDLYASKGGKIIKAGWGTGYGNYVVIDHGGGVKTLYAHMTKIYVKRGQTVNQGDVIGALGSTGWSTGPHLHFEITINGRKVNPLSYL